MPAIKSIDQRRRLLDVSQAVLCAEAGVAQSTYVRVKRGRVDPKEGTLEALRAALDRLEFDRAAQRVVEGVGS